MTVVRSCEETRDKIQGTVECLLFRARKLGGTWMGKDGVSRVWRSGLRLAFALRLEFAHVRARSIVARNAEISGSTWFSKHADAIEAAGAQLVYLPPYSPDLNPVELAISNSSVGCFAALVFAPSNDCGNSPETYSTAACGPDVPTTSITATTPWLLRENWEGPRIAAQVTRRLAGNRRRYDQVTFGTAAWRLPPLPTRGSARRNPPWESVLSSLLSASETHRLWSGAGS